MLAHKNMPVNAMIALDVDEEELKKRILHRAKTSGRTDDQDEEKINNRIKVYNEETLPVAEHYKSQGKYYDIHGIGTIEGIFSEICKVIDKL